MARKSREQERKEKHELEANDPAGNKFAGPARLVASVRVSRVAEEGLEPVNEKTGKTELPTQTGSDLAQSEWILEFTVRLTEAGFSDVQVARILEALQRTGGSGVKHRMHRSGY